MSVNRYDLHDTWSGADMKRRDNGDYVWADDYDALAAELAAVVAERDEARSEVTRLTAEIYRATRAGTPYSHQRDELNALIVRVSDLERERDEARRACLDLYRAECVREGFIAGEVSDAAATSLRVHDMMHVWGVCHCCGEVPHDHD